jgi:diacylglycerol kinase family enzyme
MKLESSTLKILTIKKNLLKSHEFELKSEADLFIDNLKSVIYPVSRKFLILINKQSGPGKSQEVLERILIPTLAQTPFSFGFCDVQSDFWSKIDDSLTDLVFLAGDGTVHRVLSEIFLKFPKFLEKINIGVLPTGSRNSLAVELSGKELMTGVFNIVRGRTIKGDLVKVRLDNEKVLLSTCAVLWGLGADIPREADELRNLGPARFPLVILRKLVRKWKQHPASLTFEDQNGKKQEKNSRFTGIFFGNHRSRNILNDEIPFPNASLHNGLVDGLLVENCGKFRSLQLFWQSMNSGAHVENPYAQFIRFKTAELKTEKKSNVSIDGEIYSASSIELTVLPGAVKFLGSLQH